MDVCERLRAALIRPVPICILISEIDWPVMVMTVMILSGQDPIRRRLNRMNGVMSALFMCMRRRCRQNPELGDGER